MCQAREDERAAFVRQHCSEPTDVATLGGYGPPWGPPMGGGPPWMAETSRAVEGRWQSHAAKYRRLEDSRRGRCDEAQTAAWHDYPPGAVPPGTCAWHEYPPGTSPRGTGVWHDYPRGTAPTEASMSTSGTRAALPVADNNGRCHAMPSGTMHERSLSGSVRRDDTGRTARPCPAAATSPHRDDCTAREPPACSAEPSPPGATTGSGGAERLILISKPERPATPPECRLELSLSIDPPAAAKSSTALESSANAAAALPVPATLFAFDPRNCGFATHAAPLRFLQLRMRISVASLSHLTISCAL